jgi:hypothetical protein
MYLFTEAGVPGQAAIFHPVMPGQSNLDNECTHIIQAVIFQYISLCDIYAFLVSARKAGIHGYHQYITGSDNVWWVLLDRNPIRIVANFKLIIITLAGLRKDEHETFLFSSWLFSDVIC